jgi:hypothetical protein
MFDSLTRITVVDRNRHRVRGAQISWRVAFDGEEVDCGPVTSDGLKPVEIQVQNRLDEPFIDVLVNFNGAEKCDRISIEKRDHTVMLDIAIPANDIPPAEISNVVILIHGIRTNAPWQNTLRIELESIGIKVELTNYGYLDIFRFLLPISYFRRKAIEAVWTSIRDIRLLYPNARLSFLAHSFGTYVLASIIQGKFDLRADKVIFCGSVVRYDFPFQDFSGRFTQPIINEVGSRDFWPAVAESVTWGYGSAGTYGFRRPRVKDRWHNGYAHSDFLTAEFCKKYWIQYFAYGKIVEADPEYQDPPAFIWVLSRLKLKYVLILVLALIFVGWYRFWPF